MAQENQPEVRREQEGGRMQRVWPQRMLSPLEEMERLFDEFLPSRMLRRPFGAMRGFDVMEARMPRVDVLERDDEILLHAEVPGVSKENLDISVDDMTVTIRAETTHEERQEEGDFYRSEISRGGFVRSVTLPAAVNSDKVHASLKDGMLELKMPKLEGAKRRKIKVQ